MTITRVGTNDKYSQGWGLAFGSGDAAKEDTKKKEAKASKKSTKAKKKTGKKKK